MKNETWISIFETIVVLAFIVGITVLVLSTWGKDVYDSQQLTFDHCCNGSPCTDTYWNGTDCVYTMGQDTNWIPLSWNTWWLPLIVVFVCAIVLVVLVHFLVPKEMKEDATDK